MSARTQSRHRAHRIPAARFAAVVAVAALASAACTNDDAGAPPASSASTSTTRSATPVPSDTNLRDVARAMIYRDGIAFVLPETAAQMTCDALSPAEWRAVFGGDIGRAVYGDVDATCRVSTGSVTVEMTRTVQELGAAGERIADRRVDIEPSSASGRVTAAQAALIPLAELDVPAQQRVGAEPVLHLLARMTDLTEDAPAPDLLPALLRRVLTTLLPRLTPEGGPATPVETAGTLAFTATEPVPGVPIYDLPQTVQSLVLCTVVPRASRITPPPAGVFVDSVRECKISEPAPIFTKIDLFLPAVQPQLTIAGHPAQESDVGIVIDLLTMPNQYGTEARHLALRLQNYRSPDQLRAWAEQVAPPLLAA